MLQLVNGRRLRGCIAAGVIGLGIVVAGCMNIPAKLQEAAQAADNGNWPLVNEIAEKCLKKERSNVTALVLNGLALHMLGRTEEATLQLEQASGLAEDSFAAQYMCGWVLSEAGRYGDALTPLRKAYRLRPDHQNLLVLLSRCCLEQNLPEGTDYLGQLRQFPALDSRPELYNTLGVLAMNQGQYGVAAKHFLSAWSREPASPTIPQNLGVLYDQYMHNPLSSFKYYNAAYAKYQPMDALRAARINERLTQLKAEVAKLTPQPAPASSGLSGGKAGSDGKTPPIKPGTKTPLTPPGKKTAPTTSSKSTTSSAKKSSAPAAKSGTGKSTSKSGSSAKR